MRLLLECDDSKIVEVCKLPKKAFDAEEVTRKLRSTIRKAKKADGFWVLWMWSRDCLPEKVDSVEGCYDEKKARHAGINAKGRAMLMLIDSLPIEDIRDMRDDILSGDYVCEQYHDDVVRVLTENEHLNDPLKLACIMADLEKTEGK